MKKTKVSKVQQAQDFVYYKWKSYQTEQALEVLDVIKREKARAIVRGILPKIKDFRIPKKSDYDLLVTEYVMLYLPRKVRIELSRHYYAMLKYEYSGLENDYNFKMYCYHIHSQIEGLLNILFDDKSFEQILLNIGEIPAYMNKGQGTKGSPIQRYEKFPEKIFSRWGDKTMAEFILKDSREKLDGRNFPARISDLDIADKFRIFIYIFKYKFRYRPSQYDKWDKTITEFYVLKTMRNIATHISSKKKLSENEQENLDYANRNRDTIPHALKKLLQKVIIWFGESYPLSKEFIALEEKFAVNNNPPETYY